ncbi:MAG: filamentous hemagglutinin N-terminal domain-containing protein [Hyellaceae cyanobacterium CSU_1_1]|nr:filamentous hemagglutinin N-terminal domain-containing protein [Pleurocapsa sp. CRU_1_2]NJR45670.1 filamentous hemagglutinin N-terminal domain-containing protein [Hyellaceae cyanobacterium CSU_1_1]
MLSANFGGYRYKFTATLTIILIMLDSNSTVQAQIVGDNTAKTQVQTDRGVSVITGGIQSGKNLFHSFEQFSVVTGGVANFDHALEVENIFSRVTGGAVSELDGLIQTQGDTSLFLLNPAGVVFGANAQLDLGGSLIVSTGDRLILPTGQNLVRLHQKVSRY